MDYYEFREMRLALPQESGTRKFRKEVYEMVKLLSEKELAEFKRLTEDLGHDTKYALKTLEMKAEADTYADRVL